MIHKIPAPAQTLGDAFPPGMLERFLSGDKEAVRYLLTGHRSLWVQEQMALGRMNAHPTIGHLPFVVRDAVLDIFHGALERFRKADIFFCGGMSAADMERIFQVYEQRSQALAHNLLETASRQAHVWFGKHDQGTRVADMLASANKEAQAMGAGNWSNVMRKQMSHVVDSALHEMRYDIQYISRAEAAIGPRRVTGRAVVVLDAVPHEPRLQEGVLQKLAGMHWGGKLALVGGVTALGATVYGMSHRQSVKTDRAAQAAPGAQLG